MSLSRFPPSERARRWLFRRVFDPCERWAITPIRRFKNASRQFRPVFVAGAMGGGTSLLAFLLGQEVECAAVINESALRVRKSSVLRIQPPTRFDDVQAFLDQMRERSDWVVPQGRADLLDLYRAYASAASDVVIDKGPNTNLLRAGFLARCFPEGKFILLFRDPVANIEGLRRKWPNFHSDSLTACIDFYYEIHDRFLSLDREIGDRVVAVEYEALIEDSERVLATLRNQLSLRPASKRMRLRPRGNFEGQGVRNVRRGRIHIVRDANSRARRRMDSKVVDRIQESLGPLYRDLRKRAAVSDLIAAGYRGWNE